MQFEAGAWLFLASACGGALGAAVGHQPFWKGILAVVAGVLANMIIAYYSPDAKWLEAAVFLVICITVSAILRLKWNQIALVVIFGLVGTVVGSLAIMTAMPGVTL